MAAAGTQAELESLWQKFSSSPSLDTASIELGQRVFEARGQQLALEERIGELSVELDAADTNLDSSLVHLLNQARASSIQALDSSLARFDQGRILLAAISLVSVGAATVTAWLLVGNGLVRPLTRLSERMRGIADGDLVTPVPCGQGRNRRPCTHPGGFQGAGPGSSTIEPGGKAVR